MSYKAFMSYSHAADDQLAPALQSALHRFAKPFYRLRAIRIFRDQTSLRLTPALWPLIQEALVASEYFLLMASPEAAQSPWVQAEVDEWLRLHGGAAENILLVLTDGEIVWHNSENDFDWRQTTALPPNLRKVFKREPLYCDLRWARKSTDLSLRNPQFLDAIGSVGAALHVKPKDEMIGDDVRQHRLFKSIVAAVIVLLLALTVAASGTAFYAIRQKNEAGRQAIEARRQKDEADRQRQSALDAAERERQAAEKEKVAREAEQKQRKKAEQATRNERTAKEQAEQRQKEAESQRRLADERRVEAERERNIATSRELAAAAVSQLPSDPELSLLLSLKAHDQTATPTTEAEESLRAALLQSHVRATYTDIFSLAPSPDWQWFIFIDKGGVKVIETATGRIIPLGLSIPSTTVPSVGFSRDGKLAFLLYRGSDNKQCDVYICEVGTWRRLDVLHSNSYIFNARFSPNSKLMLLEEVRGGKARVWDLTSRKIIEFYEVAMTFSPDSKLLISRGDRYTRLWDTATGKMLWETECGAATRDDSSPSFSLDSRYVVLPCAAEDRYANKMAYVMEVATGQKVAELPSQGSYVSGVRFSPDRRWLVTASGDNTACVWEVGTWKKVTELRGHPAAVRAFEFSPDGKWLVIASSDYSTFIWEVATWQNVDKLHGQAGSFLLFSANSKELITLGVEGALCVWQVGTWRLITTLRGHFKPLVGLAVSPEGRYLLTNHYGNTFRVWEVSTDDGVADIPWAGGAAFGHAPRMMYSHDGKSMAVEDRDGFVDVLEVDTGRKVVLGRGEFLAFSPEGKYVFLKGAEYALEIWDVQTGQKVIDLHGHTDQMKIIVNDVVHPNDVKDIAFSPDGRWVVTAGGSDNTARIWEYGTWKCVSILRDTWTVERAAFSPDGQWLITISGKAHVWKVGTWQEVTELPGPTGSFETISFSPDSRFVAMPDGSNNHTACVWEVGTWRKIVLQGHKDWVTGAVFSPNSKQVLTWSWDNTARIWDAETGDLKALFAGDPTPWRADHPNHVNSASFSPDGSLIAMASGQVVRIWKTNPGELIRILAVLSPGKDTDNSPRTVNGAIFSPDGTSLLIKTNNGITRIYKRETFAPFEEILAAARTRTTRDFTPEEKERYLHQTAEGKERGNQR